LIKPLLKQLLPPLIWNVIRSVWVGSARTTTPQLLEKEIPELSVKETYGFFGKYACFEEALMACGTADAKLNYQGASVIDATVARTKTLVGELGASVEVLVDTKTLRLLAVFQKILMSAPYAELTVLDFGGAMGHHFFRLNRLLPTQLKLKWIVLELPKTAFTARGIFKSDQLTFISDLAELNGAKIDVILASGSIQYTPRPFAILSKLMSLEAKSIILDRMPITDSFDDRILMQRVPPEIYEATYPVHFLSGKKIKSFFEAGSWQRILHWSLDEEIVMLDGKPVKYSGMLYFNQKDIRP
jgi:putative methyltransferase (TIGR04325 family)